LQVGRTDVGQRSETVRRANLSAIVRGLHGAGPLSRSELVASTGLTRSTIRALVGELAGCDLASETPAVSHGAPGRPSPVVRLNRDAATVLAVQVLVDSIDVALVGLDGGVIAARKMERQRRHQSAGQIADAVAQAAAALPVRPGPLIGVGVAVAGVVRREDGLVSMAPNLGWTDVPFGSLLADVLQLGVPIAVANDGDLGALAEHRRGAARGVDDVLYVSGEVGVGGGVIAGGHPLTGLSGYAGEIGHMSVNPAGPPCRCGSVGCWETMVGEGALLALAGLPPDAGREGVDQVLRDADAGVAEAVAAVDHVARWLGIGIANLVNIFNPRLVILGAMLGRIFPVVRPTLQAELDRRGLPAPRGVVRIVGSELGGDAALIGAAELALEPILADPAAFLGDGAARLPLASVP
jgi:predicted NBD/HSP70 family sugar kinase